MLVGTGELIEQCRLAAVLVSRQSKGQGFPFRQRVCRFRVMVSAALTQAGMLDLVVSAIGEFIFQYRNFRIFMSYIPCIGIHEDLFRIRQAQSQFISMDVQLHGISQRCKLFQRDDGTGDQPHIQKMLTERSLSSDLREYRRLSDGQFAKFHSNLLAVRW